MKKIICSHKITREIESALLKLNLEAIKLRGINKFGEFHPLNYHPDMFCFNLRANTWIFYESVCENNKEILDSLNLDIIIEPDPVSCEYPHYIGLNCAKVRESLICAKKFANAKILEEFENIIDVKQGYSRCSTCIAGDAIITADKNIYKNFPGDKLIIELGHINLHGYSYGFIGGCSGFIEDDATRMLLFTGNVELHPDYLKIKEFCGDKKIDIRSLSQEKLKDYGGLLVL